MGAGAKVEMRKLEGKIVSLEGAVRFLRDENTRLRLPAPDSPLSAKQSLAWLHDDPLSKSPSAYRKRDIDRHFAGKMRYGHTLRLFG